jgi:L-seryl-tRNA(Ser) seleniumtransferase
MMDNDTRYLLQQLPAVDRILERAKGMAEFESVPRSLLVAETRKVVDGLRAAILAAAGSVDAGRVGLESVLTDLSAAVRRAAGFNLVAAINATGVVVHTNLGRSVLADEVLDHVRLIAGHYSNLEFDLAVGRRGSRYSAVEDILCEISGAEAAMVVNNNAGAVLLCLDTLARGRRVIVSRGELVEIGGSFRIPDVMAKSGAVLVEVGATNRTHLKDYRNAVDDQTALLLKVHRSNFSIVGFTAEVGLTDMVALGRSKGVPVMEDLGSGTFVDFSRYGLTREPTVQESVAAGVDVITFSGDKLLGGPQAGVIVGRSDILDRIKTNPLTRALRVDKMTLAALEATMSLYRDPQRAVEAIPTLRMITAPYEEVRGRADRLAAVLKALGDARLEVECRDGASRTGGGALPLLKIPTRCVGVRVAGHTVNALERFMRDHRPPIIGRIEDERFVMDPRTLTDDELPVIGGAFAALLEGSDR